MSMSTVLSNYFLRHIQVMLFSLGQLWRQPVASLMTIMVIGIALALPAGLFVLQQNMTSVSEQWQSSNQITLFLKAQVPHAEGDRLSKQLASWPEVDSVQYQSKQESLDEFKSLSGLGELLDSLPDNPLPAVIIVQPTEDIMANNAIQNLLTRLSSQAEVEQAQLDMEWLQRLRSINKTIHRGITVLGTLLSLSVLLIIGNTIRLAILSRQSEIKVMKLVGATDRFVRRPFLYTGFWYGFLGGLIAWLTLLLALGTVSGPIDELISHYGSQFELQWFGGSMFVFLPTIAVLLGIAGAWVAVRRHLYMIEPN